MNEIEMSSPARRAMGTRIAVAEIIVGHGHVEPLVGQDHRRPVVLRVEHGPAAQDQPGGARRIAAARQRHDSIFGVLRSVEQTSELQSLMRISYAVFCLKKKIKLE